VAATAAHAPIVDSIVMLKALKKSGRGPRVLVDIANPRNIHPRVGALDRIFLYDLDALESIADQNRARRQKEIPKVEGIVADEVDRFLSWYESLEVVPVIRALRGRFQEIADEELKKRSKHFHSEDREALEEYTRSLLNKLLHQPTTRIRSVETSDSHGIHKLVAVQELFELDVDAYKRDGEKGKGINEEMDESGAEEGDEDEGGRDGDG